RPSCPKSSATTPGTSFGRVGIALLLTHARPNIPQRRSLRYRSNWVSLLVKAIRQMSARKNRRELCSIWN
ncbi:hypothetical protein, partial [uncultured Planktomarina sp.]|uniref:hypothetical protein n=1 Tax=uncultured Planktomarina sp. TaxID=1538529 RepID=UPI003261666F